MTLIGMLSISAVLPAYNEEKNIESAVNSCESVLKGMTNKYEIIIVNDGSTDDTGRIIDAMAKNKRIKAVHHASNKGYGAAIRSGFERAGCELVFYTDSDNQFDVKELKKLTRLIGNADIVAGYRIDRKDGLHRTVLSKGYNMLIKLFFGIKFRDIDCAFKLFRKSALDRIEIKSSGFLIDAEIMAKLVENNYVIREVGVHHYPRAEDKSTVSIAKLFRTFSELLKLRREMRD